MNTRETRKIGKYEELAISEGCWNYIVFENLNQAENVFGEGVDTPSELVCDLKNGAAVWVQSDHGAYSIPADKFAVEYEAKEYLDRKEYIKRNHLFE